MSVWKDKAGRWNVSIQRDGNRVHRSRKTRTEAKELESRLVREFRTISSGQVLIGAAIQRWLTNDVATQKSKASTESNAYSLADWVEGKSLNEIDKVARDYREFARGKLSNATINRRLAVLKRVARLSYIEWGFLQEPLHLKIQFLPENNARHVYLTREQFIKAARSLKGAARAGVMIAVYSGMRQGEILSLGRSDANGGVFRLADTKSGRPRMVPIHPKIGPYLKYLPLNISKWYLTKSFQRAARKTGMKDVRFHDLRHTTASMLAAAGEGLHVIGAILGHSQTQTTRRYTHLLVDTLRDAIKKIA